MVNTETIIRDNLRELSNNYMEAKREVEIQGMRGTFGLTFDELKDLNFRYEWAKHNVSKTKKLLDDYTRKI